MLPGLNFLSDAYFATLKVICYFLDACFKVYSKFVCLAKSDIFRGSKLLRCLSRWLVDLARLILMRHVSPKRFRQQPTRWKRRFSTRWRSCWCSRGRWLLLTYQPNQPLSHIDQIRKAFHLENLKTKSARFKKQLFGSRFKVLHLLNNSKVFCCNCHHH